MIVDVHSHCNISAHHGSYEKDRARLYGDRPDNPPDAYDEAMKAVDVSIVFGLRASRLGVATPNEYTENFVKQSTGKTIGFMALDLCDDDVMDQLEDGLSRGLKGVKLYPILAGFDATQPQHDDFFREVARLGVPLLFHTGTSGAAEAMLELSHPLLYDKLARRHPDVTMILAHMSHPWQRECVIVLRKHANVYADVSAQWLRSMEGYQALVRAQEWGVVDKLMFGSDYPIWKPQVGIDGLRAMAQKDWSPFPQIEPETIEAILHRNSLELLGLDVP
ncbi:amidohydrolase family protein [Jiangella gansuensis]|uniref:amidohydrolase family protein n=1 Tax=Jiangella gansuensis TaxID=281473 RepID=UPI0004BA11DA|nr:amidohydrolase family protein [Jiangella gansuensis]